MIKILQNIHPVFFVLAATILEVSGDTLVRKCIYEYTGTARIGFFFLGALLLFGYGFCLNLAPVEFGKVIGLYIACLFIIWQLGNYIAFKTAPSLPIVIGGLFILIGCAIITFWKQK
jgi:hypothetical protein